MPPPDMTPSPQPGQMRLWSAVLPPLPAGRYEVTLEQDLLEGGRPVGDIDPAIRHVRVTAPRFSLPGTDVTSVFPPPNAVGAFATRLPQITLARRTLPWERSDEIRPTVPWLALIVLSEAEAAFLPSVPVESVVPPGQLAGLTAAERQARCAAIEVTTTVVEKVFPRQDELELLCHVRQVNLKDTELAGPDDDGWVAVLLSHRLPQPGTRYAAYLVSLEGRVEDLPAPVEPETQVDEGIGHPLVYSSVSVSIIDRASAGRTDRPYDLSFTAGVEAVSHTASSTPQSEASPWNEAAVAASEIEARQGGTEEVGPEAPFSSDVTVTHDVDLTLIEPGVPKLRFCVLAHWRFACGERGDFQYLMSHLDDGLLGTRPRPIGGEPDDTTASARPTPPQVTDTGHTVLDHLTRAGERSQCWYRGPLTPREVARRPAATAPVFTADQARRVGADDREDLSEAAAFEIGRLLALSDARFMAELSRWRRSDFGARHLKLAVDSVPELSAMVGDGDAVGRRLAGVLLEQVGVAEGAALGPRVDPNPVAHLLAQDDVEIIARGLDVPAEVVADVLSGAMTRTALEATDAPPRGEDRFHRLAEDTQALDNLRKAQNDSADAVRRNARTTSVARSALRHPASAALEAALGPDDEEGGKS